MRELTEEIKNQIKNYVYTNFAEKDLLFKTKLIESLCVEYVNNNFEVE